MKTFKEIFIDENMEMPNKYGITRVQRINLDSSVEFEFNDESKAFLRGEPHKAETIYEPTLKKFAENIILLNIQKHRKDDRSRISLMNDEIYHGYRNISFYTTK
jgi:hypothetical protein